MKNKRMRCGSPKAEMSPLHNRAFVCGHLDYRRYYQDLYLMQWTITNPSRLIGTYAIRKK